jgi:hypothetical protein
MPCVLCGFNGKRSREHVFPQWLRALFPDLGDADYIRRLVTHATDEQHERPGKPFDVVVRDVCATCNNGWMSGLETRAQVILTPMVSDQPRVLTAPEQFTVATWATKTMLTMQGANIRRERVASPEQYRWFGANQAPLPSSQVWLCRYDDRTRWPLSTHQWGMTLRPATEPAPQEGDPLNGFGVVYAIGPVVFWLFGADLPGDPRPNAGSDDAHVLIWPALGRDVRWPPRKTLAREADLEALARRVPRGGRDAGARHAAHVDRYASPVTQRLQREAALTGPVVPPSCRSESAPAMTAGCASV